MDTAAVADLVAGAREGDEAAWDALVARHVGLVHAICRAHRLTRDEASEVNQLVWLRLVEHLDRIRTPEAIGGWIAATTRVECLRVLRPAGGLDAGIDGRPSGVDAGLLVYERDRRLMAGFERLAVACQQLLRLHAVDPAPTTAEVAAALDLIPASVGPARERCLEQLRQALA